MGNYKPLLYPIIIIFILTICLSLFEPFVDFDSISISPLLTLLIGSIEGIVILIGAVIAITLFFLELLPNTFIAVYNFFVDPNLTFFTFAFEVLDFTLELSDYISNQMLYLALLPEWLLVPLLLVLGLSLIFGAIKILLP